MLQKLTASYWDLNVFLIRYDSKGKSVLVEFCKSISRHWRWFFAPCDLCWLRSATVILFDTLWITSFLIRVFNVLADKKLPGAGKKSEYYRKYGNPSFGGELSRFFQEYCNSDLDIYQVFFAFFRMESLLIDSVLCIYFILTSVLSEQCLVDFPLSFDWFVDVLYVLPAISAIWSACLFKCNSSSIY
jgi:hypothetical protein